MGELSWQRPEARQRSVESAVLAIVIEGHPGPLTRSKLLDEMSTRADDVRRIADIDCAVEGLVDVGLLAGSQAALSPTPAALRLSELDLGL